MPTPNDYSRVILSGNMGGSETSDSPSEYGQVNPSRTSGQDRGNYPDTYAPNMGENYPSRAEVFSAVDTCRNSDEGSYKTHGGSKSGEFEQASPQYINGAPYPGTNMVPSPTPSKQFASDVNGNPDVLLETTRASVMQHSDLNQAYGLNQPVAGLGTHPWLRDSLATQGETEPGNAEPSHDEQIPMRKMSR